jgi:hypothetical protein
MFGVFHFKNYRDIPSLPGYFFICLTQQTCPILRHLPIVIFQFYHKGINSIFPSINAVNPWCIVHHPEILLIPFQDMAKTSDGLNRIFGQITCSHEVGKTHN